MAHLDRLNPARHFLALGGDYRGASAQALHERLQRLSEVRKRRILNFLATKLKRVIGQAAASTGFKEVAGFAARHFFKNRPFYRYFLMAYRSMAE